MSKSWKPAVKTAGSVNWGYNALRFATEKEAYDWACDLAFRWSAVEDVAAHESDDAPTHLLDERGRAQPL
jgi:hypothetical protein